jgi:hypothetical protein
VCGVKGGGEKEWKKKKTQGKEKKRGRGGGHVQKNKSYKTKKKISVLGRSFDPRYNTSYLLVLNTGGKQSEKKQYLKKKKIN